MNVVNITKNKTLYKNAKYATNFFDQLLGLANPSNPRGMVLKTRFGIHTFGLKEPIDVLILDKNKNVIVIKTVKPNKIFFWNPKYNLVVELPNGLINKTGTKMGDKIKMAKF